MQKLFITDTDIYRFTDTMAMMWQQSNKPLIGANYATYPIEVVEKYCQLSAQEKLLYQIFEGDKTPIARQALAKHNQIRNIRVKGSLMLLETEIAKGMHRGQDLASDSIINAHFGQDNIQIANDSFFMHMGRIDLADHVKARLRHYRGAKAQNNIEGFLKNQVTLPDENKIDHIASDIRASRENGTHFSRLYLLRCALRHSVDQYCLDIILNNRVDYTPEKFVSIEETTNFAEAKLAINALMSNLNWPEIQGFSKDAPPPTQTMLPRVPIDLASCMQDEVIAKIIFRSLK